MSNSLHYSIGKSQRQSLGESPNKIVPGPGTYQSNSMYATQQSPPRWRFGSSKRPALNRKSMTGEVGPGQYVITSHAIEGKKQTFGLINDKEKKYFSISPGPGTYAPKSARDVVISYSLA